MASELRRLEPLTARQTIALPEPAEGALLLGPFVIRGGRTIVAGASGHGKTTLALAMVAAVVRGAEFLGERGAGVGPGLVLDLEQGLRSVKRGLREAGLADHDDLYIVRAPDGLALDAEDGADLAELDRVLAEVEPAVVLVDPLYKAHRVEANEERPVVDLMRRLDGLREAYGFALLLPAHVRKAAESGGARKLILDDVAGSGAITRGAEVVLGLERIAHGFARLRVLKDRDGDLAVGEATSLSFTREGGFAVREEEDLEAKAVEVGADGEWRTVREWAPLLGCRERKARGLLEALAETGQLEAAVGPPGRSRNARCWRVQTTPDARAHSGVAAESDGQGSLLRPSARVLTGGHGRGVVVGAPEELRSAHSDRAQSGGVVADDDDVERWRSLLEEGAAAGEAAS